MEPCITAREKIHHWNAIFLYWNWFFVKVIKVVKLFNSFHCVSFLKVCFTFIFPHLFPYYFVWFRFTVSFRLGHRHPSFGRPTAKHMVKGISKWRDSLSHTHTYTQKIAVADSGHERTQERKEENAWKLCLFTIFFVTSHRGIPLRADLKKTLTTKR